MADSDKNKPSVTDACTVCTGRKVLIGSAVAFLLLATTLSMCMVVVFIHNNQLLSRMEELEAMVSSCNCQVEQQEETMKKTLQSMLKSLSRNKRGILKPISDKHTHSSKSELQKSERGIPSHDIALVYGDESLLENAVNSTDVSIQQYEPIPRGRGRGRGVVYARRDKQKFMLGENYLGYRNIPLYHTSRDNRMYSYFKKASWMNNTRSIQNFNLTHDGKIVVGQQGLYIIQASICFSGIYAGNNPHYGVYKTNAKGASHQLLSKCIVTLMESENDDGSGVYPCKTWQLAHLRTGDQVFMSIESYVWFQVEKETFHLALIKLNDYSL